jgi:hypothetical protein
MGIPKRVLATGLGMVLLLGSGTIPLAAQETGAAKKAGKVDAPAASKATGTRRLPNYFGQIGLSSDQRESVYTILAKHQDKIDGLEKQLADARAELMRACEGVLTDPQKQLLSDRRKAVKKEAPGQAKATAPMNKTGANPGQ